MQFLIFFPEEDVNKLVGRYKLLFKGVVVFPVFGGAVGGLVVLSSKEVDLFKESGGE